MIFLVPNILGTIANTIFMIQVVVALVLVIVTKGNLGYSKGA